MCFILNPLNPSSALIRKTKCNICAPKYEYETAVNEYLNKKVTDNGLCTMYIYLQNGRCYRARANWWEISHNRCWNSVESWYGWVDNGRGVAANTPNYVDKWVPHKPWFLTLKRCETMIQNSVIYLSNPKCSLTLGNILKKCKMLALLYFSKRCSNERL